MEDADVFHKKAHSRSVWVRRGRHRRAVRDHAGGSAPSGNAYRRASEVYLGKRMAAAMAPHADHAPSGNMIVDIGGGDRLSQSSRSPASSQQRPRRRQREDDAIISIKKTHYLLIGERTAGGVKMDRLGLPACGSHDDGSGRH